MKTIIALAILLVGCASAPSMMYQGMSADQINAAAKDNKAVFDCTDIDSPSFPSGQIKVKRRSMVIDSGTVRYGQFIAKNCDDITFTNENKAPTPKVTP